MREELLRELSAITPEEQAILDGKRGIDPAIYTESGQFVVDRHKILDEGRLIRIRTHTRFAAFPKHSHNYVEMVYMCKGQTHHTVDGTPITLREGEILIMNQNAVQEIKAAGEGDIAVNFIILPEFFDMTLRVMGQEDSALKEFLISALQSRDASMTYLHFRVSEVVPVQNLMENLIYSLLYNSESAREDELVMGLLFLQLLRQTRQLQTDRRSYDYRLVMDALAYIDAHYKEGSMTQFAGMHHVELTSLSRLVHKLTGFHWQELLQQKRMARACELLEASGLTVADVAAAVGYENVSFFHRLFKRYYGQSPRQYRRMKANLAVLTKSEQLQEERK